MRYGSVCSGIEAATVAWEPLGWSARFFSEIDPFCCALLRHHYPDVPNLGDLANVRAEHGPIDVLVGGTPCQAFSVNGQREGLSDPRGGITLDYLRVLHDLRPRWFVWENVAGVLDLERGRPLAAFLGALGQLDYGYAGRVLDLVGFGVPQQRRRLFLVGRLGGGFRAAGAVLADLSPGGKHARAVRAVREEGVALAVGDAGPFGWTGDPTPKCCPGFALTLRASQGGEGAGVGWPGRARRFTLREWERLMGLADDYTVFPYRDATPSDSLRRHAVGNSFPVPVLSWIGSRIDHLERHS